MKAKARLTIQEQTQREGDFDEQPEKWKDIRVEKFVLMPLTAREFIQAQQMQSQVSHKGQCPWFAGYNTRERGTALRLMTADKSRTFHVESVVNRNEQNRILDWMLVEVNG